MDSDGTGDTYKGPDYRASPRVRPPCRVFFSSGRLEGTGVLRDLSAAGACLEDTTSSLNIGTAVVLTLELQEDGFTVNIAGKVARQTPGGFAVEFYLEADPSVEQFMGWLIARFSPPTEESEDGALDLLEAVEEDEATEKDAEVEEETPEL